MSERTGPISFSDRTARRQLLDHGQVVTFRASERTTGDTHARWERTGTKQADVIVNELGTVEPTKETLADYREDSGFDTVGEWLAAIERLNGSVPGTGHLYRTELVDFYGKDPDRDDGGGGEGEP